MGKAKPKYNVHFWNLDYLESFPLQFAGDLKPIYPPQASAADKVALLARGEIVTLRHRDKILEVFKQDTKQRLDIYKFDPQENLADMVVVRDSLYFWETTRNAIIQLDLSDLKVVVTKKWTVDTGEVGFTKLAVMRDASGSHTEAYLAPTSAGTILAIELDTDLKTRSIPAPPNSTGLSKNVHLCVDARAKSLFVTEPEAQLITEIDARSGESKLLWTPYSPDCLDLLGDSFKAGRSRPCALAIYRTGRMVPKNILKNASRTLLESDSQKIRPRTLLIADTGNYCLWKLVQLPVAAPLMDLSGKTQLLAFIGTGKAPQVTKNYNPSRSEQENLRRYVLPPPREVSVSSFGEVLIQSDPEYPLILLRPATSRPESLVNQEARIRKMDLSD